MTRKPDDLTRREVLSQTALGVATLGLAGLSSKLLPGCATVPAGPAAKPAVAAPGPGGLVVRTLGRTGLQLPVVSMGVMNTADGALVKKSYEIGVRHFDTAAGYMKGRNEEILGRALKELGVRAQAVIATKAHIRAPERASLSTGQVKEMFLNIFEGSLKRLQTDYVDILYSHNVESVEWLNNPGVLEALRLVKQQGKARFIGFTTHSRMNTCIEDAVRSGAYEVILTSLNYSLHDDSEYLRTLQSAAQKGIGLIAMKTQCMRASQKKRDGKREFYEGPILHTALLKWVMRHEFMTTAVPGYTSFQEMEEDFSVARGLAYTDAEKKFLADKKVQVALGSVCRQCGRCRPTCPGGVDVPELMRAHMYAASYDNPELAREVLAQLPARRGIDRCLHCQGCAALCARRVPVARRVDELRAMLG
jgi:hypothetical protein